MSNLEVCGFRLRIRFKYSLLAWAISFFIRQLIGQYKTSLPSSSVRITNSGTSDICSKYLLLQVSRDAVERDGSDANILVAAIAAVGDQATGQLATAEGNLYIDSASGTALDRIPA